MPSVQIPAANLGVPTAFSRFNNSLEQLTGFRKVLYLGLQFYYSEWEQIRIIQNRRNMGPSLEGSECKASIFLRDVLPSQHWSTQDDQPGMLTQIFWVQGLGFYYVSMIDGIIAQMVELNLLECYRLAQRPNPLITWLVVLAPSAPKTVGMGHLLCITYIRCPPWASSLT